MEGFRHLVSPETRTYLVGSFPPVLHPSVPPHTLVLGTMPSASSHARAQYYAHPSNAFWWMAGEALGFRRGGPCGEEGAWPLQWDTRPARDILTGLRGEGPVLGYSQQVEALTKAGYALWDVVKQCRIRNSEDASIREKEPNDVRGLVEAVPSIRRIVFTGRNSAQLFLQLHRGWLRGGGFCLGKGRHTAAVFGKLVQEPEDGRREDGDRLELVVPVSVSPAAAGVRFPGKREEWLGVVFHHCI
jgi:G:T/U-mismatch repair DNA glycosylase